MVCKPHAEAARYISSLPQMSCLCRQQRATGIIIVCSFNYSESFLLQVYHINRVNSLTSFTNQRWSECIPDFRQFISFICRLPQPHFHANFYDLQLLRTIRFLGGEAKRTLKRCILHFCFDGGLTFKPHLKADLQ